LPAVPVPLVDLALSQAEYLGEPSNLFLAPLGRLLELVFEDKRLIHGLLEPVQLALAT
jgi:hypothetical protein